MPIKKKTNFKNKLLKTNQIHLTLSLPRSHK